MIWAMKISGMFCVWAVDSTKVWEDTWAGSICPAKPLLLMAGYLRTELFSVSFPYPSMIQWTLFELKYWILNLSRHFFKKLTLTDPAELVWFRVSLWYLRKWANKTSWLVDKYEGKEDQKSACATCTMKREKWRCGRYAEFAQHATCSAGQII